MSENLQVTLSMPRDKQDFLKMSLPLFQATIIKTDPATPETVTISRHELDILRLASSKLSALEEAGVDNWEGYGVAMRRMHEEEDDGA